MFPRITFRQGLSDLLVQAERSWGHIMFAGGLLFAWFWERRKGHTGLDDSMKSKRNNNIQHEHRNWSHRLQAGRCACHWGSDTVLAVVPLCHHSSCHLQGVSDFPFEVTNPRLSHSSCSMQPHKPASAKRKLHPTEKRIFQRIFVPQPCPVSPAISLLTHPTAIMSRDTWPAWCLLSCSAWRSPSPPHSHVAAGDIWATKPLRALVKRRNCWFLWHCSALKNPLVSLQVKSASEQLPSPRLCGFLHPCTWQHSDCGLGRFRAPYKTVSALPCFHSCLCGERWGFFEPFCLVSC